MNTLTNHNEIDDTVAFLKHNYNLSDFLEFDKTNEVLNMDHSWSFYSACDELLDDFYIQEVNICRDDLSSLFINELNHKHLNVFKQMVFDNIQPVYNLEEVYNNPTICDLFIKHRAHKKPPTNKQKRQDDIRLNYKDVSKNKHLGKTFNWSTKTYK
jgi:hypothetical protein